MQPDGRGGDAADAAARIAALEAENRALRDDAARARLILSSATDFAIITMDMDGCITSWNVGAERIMGYAEPEMLGRSGNTIFTAEDRAEGRFTAELCRALEHGTATNERWHVRRDGNRFWASGTMMTLLDSEGDTDGFLNILRDRTDARAEVERRELLMAEMNHRIRNTLTVVQVVAAQTGRYAPAPADFLDAFGGRLLALSRSHDVLTRTGWDAAPLRDVVEGALAAYAGEPGRVTIDGLAVTLAANLVMTISLAFHELATNAAKYGALSTPSGQVTVTWTISREGRGGRQVEIVWRERGGPPVAAPDRRGFGSQLLERGLKGSATVRLDYQPDGVTCHIGVPLGTGSALGGVKAEHAE